MDKNNPIMDKNNPNLKAGDSCSGFLINRVKRLELVNAVFYEMEHRNTGARYVHVSRDDNENTFAAAFKTVPEDSTGVPHILEHTALCASEKYPVSDPFFSMLKRSLSTFMNAFTAPDWTMYPFSTQNKRDFFNLMDVYLNAAFFPKLQRLSFLQESCRIEVEPDGELVYKGVVYNEMMGVFSSPPDVMERSILSALYPDTAYSHESGGDPRVIPGLTHADLKRFHKRFYHPSNAFFYSYGNFLLSDTLEFIEKNVLKLFTAIDPETEVANQPKWKSPKKRTANYPLSENDAPGKKFQVCMGWLMADATDTFEALVLSFLSRVLLANAASPLRKALINSELGCALSDGTGFEPGYRDMMFVCGLKDVKKESEEDIERIILETLRDLAENGVPRELADAALHRMEFAQKEVANRPYPYGLKLFMGIVGSWLHGGDPAERLEIDPLLERLKRKLQREDFLKDKIREYFTENPHRVLLTLIPDTGMEKRERARIREELARKRAALSREDVERIKSDTEMLAELHSKKEDLSCLPTLGLSDVPPDIETMEEKSFDASLDLTCYDRPTSGILYFTAAAGAGLLPEELLKTVPFLCHVFNKIGTETSDYAQLAKKIELFTGGIGLSASAEMFFGRPQSCLPVAVLGAKALDGNAERMFEILRELTVLFTAKDHERLKILLLEYRAALESSIIYHGHKYAMSLAARNLLAKCALDEIWDGISQLLYIKELTADMSEAAVEKIARDLERTASLLFSRNNLKMALVGEENAVAEAGALVRAFHNGLSENGGDGFIEPKIAPGDEMPREGWSIASAVSFSARLFLTKGMPHADSPGLAVISKILKHLYMHREIREKGGAYGGYSLYSPADGLFSFASYRDPHIVSTLEAFARAPAFIANPSNYGERDVKEAILQVCSDIDKPSSPAGVAKKAFFRKIFNVPDAERKRFKENLLLLRHTDVAGIAEKYFGVESEHGIAVISGEDKLKEANARLAEGKLTLHRI